MEKGFESWFRDQQIDWKSADPNSSSSPFGLRHRLIVPSFRDMLSQNPTNGNLPFSAFAAHEPRKASLPEEPCGWFHGLPRYHQGFAPLVNSILKEQLPENFNDKVGAANGVVRKTFLVFDQSNDQTTLIYSSDIRAAPIQYSFPTWNNPKHQPTLERKAENSTSRVDEYIEENDESEMREDTEELNALLYSDDEIDYSEDEEEMSTGHSPSSITGFDRRQERLDELDDEEDVASSGPRKRHKLEYNGGYNVISLEDTASSGKSGINCSDDGELSSSGDGNGVVEEESGSFPPPAGDKRSRKEKVRETISILQNLIPGDQNGKDAMMIIDEAIQYLRSLKGKVKALGLDSL